MFKARYQMRPLPQQPSHTYQSWNTLLFWHRPKIFRGNIVLLESTQGLNTFLLLNGQWNCKHLLICGNFSAVVWHCSVGWPLRPVNSCLQFPVSFNRFLKFCAIQKCDSAVTTRVRSAWKKFHEYLPILTGKGFSLKLKGKVYATCVRSCLMHGSETWPTKVQHELKMNCTEMSMIRWMCGVKLNERKKSELLGLEPVSLMIKKSRLRWFEHVERKNDNDWVKRCITWEAEWIRQRGCPKKTW